MFHNLSELSSLPAGLNSKTGPNIHNCHSETVCSVNNAVNCSVSMFVLDFDLRDMSAFKS